MLNDLENFYEEQDEPIRSCYLALRDILLRMDSDITEHWKYRLPFFYYKGKMMCYFWKDKKTKMPYIGMVYGRFINSPLLEQGSRKTMKVMPIDPEKDIPVKVLKQFIHESMEMIEKKVKFMNTKKS